MFSAFFCSLKQEFAGYNSKKLILMYLMCFYRCLMMAESLIHRGARLISRIQ